jgi:hypothetical protein
VIWHGLDYVTLYRNPIEHQVDRGINSLPGMFTAFGYNLASDGELTLFWQNLGLDRQQLWVGLARTQGVYSAGSSAVNSASRQWIPCIPTPDFTDEVDAPKAIIESSCPLNSIDMPAGLYDLQLAVGDGATLMPVSSSRLAVLLVDSDDQFLHIDLAVASP